MRARRSASGPSNVARSDVSSRTWVEASGRRPSPKTIAGAADLRPAAGASADEDAEDGIDDGTDDPPEDRAVADRDDQQNDQEEAVLGEEGTQLPGRPRREEREQDCATVERRDGD